jgi:hypothetical protein
MSLLRNVSFCGMKFFLINITFIFGTGFIYLQSFNDNYFVFSINSS